MNERMGHEVLNRQKFYRRISNLKSSKHKCIISPAESGVGSGWYQFTENRMRGYVRLVAERNGIQLNSEHPLGKKLELPPYDYIEPQ